MPSRRRSFGRVFLVAILVVIALLLLELGRLLPGSWPGGGGDGGSRSFPAGAKPDPTNLVPSATPPPPKAAEPGTLRVVVRRADGTPVEGGAIVLGGTQGGASVELVGGEALLRIGSALPDDWAVELPDGSRIAHGRAPPRGSGRWVATLPERPMGRPAIAGSPASAVRIEDADGRPLAGATVTATGRAGEREVRSGPDGVASLPDADGVQRICASAPGYGESCIYARLGADGPAVIRLSPMRTRRTTFVDPATGAALKARSLTLIGRRGVAKRLERTGETFGEFETTMPDDVAEGTTLEIDVAGRPPVRVPIASMNASTPIPAGAPRTLRWIDEKGDPVVGADVTARFVAGGAPEQGSSEPVETTTTTTTDEGGRAVLSLPIDRDTDLVFESPTFAALGVRVPSGAPAQPPPLEVRASRGVDCVVSVRDARGAPVADADVRVLFAAGRTTARRRASTDAAGEAVLRAVPAGLVEVLVHRAGFQWMSKTGSPSDGPLRFAFVLRPGNRLTLVVEDPSGAPVPRVAVRSVLRPTPGEAPTEASDPDQTLPWETDEHGVLVVEDLPDREIDLYLSKPGFDEEVVARARPGASTWFATMVPAPAK